VFELSIDQVLDSEFTLTDAFVFFRSVFAHHNDAELSGFVGIGDLRQRQHILPK
jgi:hypothetical protein